MANYRSRPQPFNRLTSSIDEDRMNKAMDVIDSRYQNNISKTYSAINQVASIDLLRESDQEHLHKNLKSVLDMLDNTDNIDYSKGNVGGQLQGYIASAIDGQTLKHAGIAAKYKNFEAELAKKQEKNDGTYNQGNHQDALKQAGFYDYMNNESDTVSSFNYTNYVDVNDKMLKNIKQMKDLRPDEKVEFLNPETGQYVKKKISTLNKTEWQRVIQTSFDDNDKAQLAINGRQAYNYNDQLAIQDLEKRRGDLSSKYDSEIEKLKAMKVSSSSDIQKVSYQSRIDNLTKEKNASLTTLDTGAKTAGQIGSFLTQRHMSIDMANIMAKETILSNKIDYKYLNEKAKYLKTLQETKSDQSVINSGVTTKAQPVDLQKLEGRKAIDVFSERKENSVTKTREVLKTAYDKIKNQEYNGSTVGKEIDILEGQIIKEYTEQFGEAPDEFTLHRLVVDKADYLLDANTKFQLNETLLETEQFFNAEKEAKSSAIDNEIIRNSEKLYDQTNALTNDFQMFDKGGVQMSNKEFFNRNNINSKEDLTNFLASNSEQAKIYKANVMLQTVGASTKRNLRNLQQFLITSGSTGRGLASTINYGFEGADKMKVDYAREILGDEKFSEIFDKTARLETEASFIQSGSYALFTPDKTLGNEGAFRTVDDDSMQKEYEKQLNLESATIPGMNTLIIDPQVVKGAPTNALHKELTSITTKDFDIKRPVGLIDNGDTITLYQEDEQQVQSFTSSGDITSGLKSNYRTEIINKNDISHTNYPVLFKQLEDQEDKADIDFFKQSGFEKENINFYEDSANQAQGLLDLFGNDQSIIQQASKSTASPYIKRSLQKALTGKQGANQFYQIVDKSIEQSDKFNVSLSTSDSGGYSQVQIKMKTRKHTEENPDYEVLYTQPINTSSDKLNKVLHGAPQVMITTLLLQAGNQVSQDNVTLANKIAKNLD